MEYFKAPHKFHVVAYRATKYAILALLVPEMLLSLAPLLGRQLAGDLSTLRVLALALTLTCGATLVGVWRQRPWAPWLLLVVTSMELTIELSALAQSVGRTFTATSFLLLAITLMAAFAQAPVPGPRNSVYLRMLFGSVAAFAGIVAFWGLCAPEEMAHAIPLSVPPLHARFLGAMYLSGTVLMIGGIAARQWREVRVVTLMLALWTGLLGAVSVGHLDAFDWARLQTWFWFFAYIDFPLAAFWIAWAKRTESSGADVVSGFAISAGLRAYLRVQGMVAVVLAMCCLLLPGLMVRVWPWPIKLLLAQIYGAPFLSFGIGSLYAASRRDWAEVRVVALGALTFTLSVVVASLLHSQLFDPRSISAWVWFGGFGVASGILLLFNGVPVLRRARI
jgi:uncharacterized membrane protein (DUF2068 family)